MLRTGSHWKRTLAVLSGVALATPAIIAVPRMLIRGCHLELRPVAGVDPIHDLVDHESDLGPQCEGGCTGGGCPAEKRDTDATGSYKYCPDCTGGEDNCCHAIVRRVLDGGEWKYRASAKGSCSTPCGTLVTTCQLISVEPVPGDKYWVGACKPETPPGG